MAFPSSSSQYIADVRLDNNPWHGVDEWALKVLLNNGRMKDQSDIKMGFCHAAVNHTNASTN